VITTTHQRTVAGCTVLMDDTDALQVYAVPQSPHIALDEQGKAKFALVEYRRPLDQVPEADRATKLGGGLLTFSVDLALSADQETAIRTALSTDPALQQMLATAAADRVDYSHWWNVEVARDVGKLAVAIKINGLPVEDGRVAVAIDGEDATSPGEFVTTLVGAGKVSMTGDERAAFSAKLTIDGAALLWEMIERNLSAIWVGYQLTFTSRLDGVTMVCFCDTTKIYSALQNQWQNLSEIGSFSDKTSGSSSTHTYDHASSNSAGDVLHKFALDTETAFVHIVPTAGPDVVTPEMLQQLTTQGWNMITQFLSDKLLQSTNPDDFTTKDDPTLQTTLADGGGGRKYGADNIKSYKLKQVDETTLGTFTAQFDEKATVKTQLNPTDNLSNVLNGQDVRGFRTQIDLDPQFYHYADVEVSCTADFDSEPVDAVTVHMEYHGTGDGGRIDKVQDLKFTKNSVSQFFSTYLASPDQDSYTYAVEVFYSGTSKTYQYSGKSNGTELVLDTDTLGILSVDLQAGIVDWDRFKAVQVEFSYGTGAQSAHTSLTLDAGKQADRWLEVLGAAMSGDYSYTVTWVDKSDQQIRLPLAISHDKRLVIDQPLRESLAVTLVPAGAFGEGGLLSKIVTALRYQDPAHKYEQATTITMSSDNDVSTWSIPLMDATLRSYQYQVNVFYSDGVTRDSDWMTTDRTVLPVGDPYGWRVQFIPYLLRNPPGKWGLATLHVEFTDTAGSIAIAQDYSITDFTQSVIWRFRLASPDRHSYTYQLALFGVDPATPTVTLPTVTDTREVVVLPTA
jgi:hypothetical protein